MVIDTAGQFPVPDVKAFEAFGKELIQREKAKVAESKGKGDTITLKLNKKQEINQIEIQEDITKGEHIRSYEVEALMDGRWFLKALRWT